MLVPPWVPSVTESPSAWRCSELCGPMLGAPGVVSTSGNRAGQDVPGMGLGGREAEARRSRPGWAADVAASDVVQMATR